MNELQLNLPEHDDRSGWQSHKTSEAYLTAMTGDRHDDLAAFDLNLTLSWLVWTSTVMLVWLYFSSPYCFFYFVFEHETIIYYKRVSCVWFLLPYVKTLKTRTVHFVYSLRIFVSAHVIITSITECLQTFVRFFCCICRLACSEISLSIKEKKN